MTAAAATGLSHEDAWSIVEGTFEAVLHAVVLPADPGTVLDDPLTASVAVHGDPPRTVTFSCGRSSGEALARTMFALQPGHPVADEDVEDAVGEIVNIIGGNVKSVVDGARRLGLPRVSNGSAPALESPLWRETVAWRGHVAVITLWRNGSEDLHDTDDDEGRAR